MGSVECLKNEITVLWKIEPSWVLLCQASLKGSTTKGFCIELPSRKMIGRSRLAGQWCEEGKLLNSIPDLLKSLPGKLGLQRSTERVIHFYNKNQMGDRSGALIDCERWVHTRSGKKREEAQGHKIAAPVYRHCRQLTEHHPAKSASIFHRDDGSPCS